MASTQQLPNLRLRWAQEDLYDVLDEGRCTLLVTDGREGADEVVTAAARRALDLAVRDLSLEAGAPLPRYTIVSPFLRARHGARAAQKSVDKPEVVWSGDAPPRGAELAGILSRARALHQALRASKL